MRQGSKVTSQSSFRVEHGILMHEKSVLVVKMWKIRHIFVHSLHTFSVEQSFVLILQYTKLVVCMYICGIQVSHVYAVFGVQHIGLSLSCE